MKHSANPYGNIYLSPKAIATIAYHAALESYGVVGLAPKNLAEGIAQVLVKEPTHGVDVHFTDDSVVIDLYIIVEYGTRIQTVASSVADNVRYQIEKNTGLPVKEVNVHVRGLRVSNTD
ncbi:MAG: Asp23/Gls24 family envelope stress response protein [Thermanaerothrix sp.]|nr:Asp23/Gls24 family envelope stress response protein [Thermanaerothrix sp.]